MTNPELQQAWAEHKEEESAAARERREWAARIQEGRARAKLAAEKANKLTDIIGYHSDDPRHDIYDVRISNPVPLGKLEDTASSEGKFGFAKVFVFRDKETVERQVKGRFFTRTEYDRVTTDKIANVGVAFLAGTEDGQDLVSFRQSNWSITASDDLEMMNAVEADLSLVAEVVGLQRAAES